MKTSYAILVNPVSGVYDPSKKRAALIQSARILDNCEIFGLNTRSKAEFCELAHDLSKCVETLVVAGGDGTFSDVMNSVGSDAQLGYIPMGSGNLLGWNLGYKPGREKGLERAALQIRNGSTQFIDVILYNDSIKTMVNGIGFEAFAIKRSEEQRGIGTCEQNKGLQKSKSTGGLLKYVRATASAFFDYAHTAAIQLSFDGETIETDRFYSATISKYPKHTHNASVMPGARLDDGKLHMLTLNKNLALTIKDVGLAVTLGMVPANYVSSKELSLSTDQPIPVHLDGNYIGDESEINFKVLPGELRLVC
ncbi:hypothetical protein HOK51_09110 [Candidatus Woesearchaeota archaeon]|jgi:diacylglycerol kinase (ATP)|nr:hypothetical protein [Candidatus Woesearchaeota archaeon]MBT6519988.1 hypothetical protein [Candidatus Woesearchaeota archaeon]MBT7367811.1 hypothetical protein [Candidatus Woesearchaeota archaeon]